MCNCLQTLQSCIHETGPSEVYQTCQFVASTSSHNHHPVFYYYNIQQNRLLTCCVLKCRSSLWIKKMEISITGGISQRMKHRFSSNKALSLVVRTVQLIRVTSRVIMLIKISQPLQCTHWDHTTGCYNIILHFMHMHDHQ